MAHLAVEGERRIYYEHYSGTGRPILLVHGWGMSARVWDLTLPALLDAGHEVVASDHRACGSSDKDFDDTSIDAVGSDCVRLVEKLGLDGVVLNGWSLGGAVVVDAAGKLGDRLGGLVLTGGATPRYLQGEGFPHGGTPDIFEQTLTALRDTRPEFLHALASGVCATEVGQPTVNWMWNIFMQTSARADAALAGLGDLDQRDILAKITVPALLCPRRPGRHRAPRHRSRRGRDAAGRAPRDLREQWSCPVLGGNHEVSGGAPRLPPQSGLTNKEVTMATFGLAYDFRNPDQWKKPYETLYREVLDQIVWAEKLGFRSVWLTEHHFCDDGYTPSPLVIAAAIGARTKQMRIGTNLLALPLHDPMRIAEDAATVSILTGGRFLLGVGQGYHEEEFDRVRPTARQPSEPARGGDRDHPPGLDRRSRELHRAAVQGRGRAHHARPRQPSADPRRRPGRPGHRAGGPDRRRLPRHPQRRRRQVRRRAARVSARRPRTGAIFALQWPIIDEDPERTWAEVGKHSVYQWNEYIGWGVFGPPDQIPRYEDPKQLVEAGMVQLLGRFDGHRTAIGDPGRPAPDARPALLRPAARRVGGERFPAGGVPGHQGHARSPQQGQPALAHPRGRMPP